MNRNRIKLDRVRNGHTICLASQSNGMVDKIRVVKVKSLGQRCYEIEGAISTRMYKGEPLTDEETREWGYSDNALLFVSGPWDDIMVTLCENKALRWARSYKPNEDK